MQKALALFAFLTVTTATCFAQNASAIYHETIALLKNKGYSISTEQVADLSQGHSAYYWKTFYTGNDYVIVAMSDDEDVTDVDIFLYEENGDLYAQDTDVSSVAIVKMSPLVTRNMKVVIKNYASNNPNYESRCRFVVAYAQSN